MRSLGLVLVFSYACLAQNHWEIGAAGGGGVYHNASVSAGAGSADIGFATQWAGGVVIGENLYQRLGGEFRYTFRDGDLRLKTGGQQAAMEGRAHALHYDLLLHATHREAKVRPFGAIGGGIKVYQGTGKEAAFQPLSGFALLTKTDQVEPLLSFGGGVKVSIARHAIVRVDVRDYVTPTPERLFAPARGGKIHGWLHDFVPLVGVSAVF
jgi:hypothetical protein